MNPFQRGLDHSQRRALPGLLGLVLGALVSGCPLSAPDVGGHPITCTRNSDCQHGERCDTAYGICVGLGDGGITGEDGGNECNSSDCFGAVALSSSATSAGGTLYAGANVPLSLFADMTFANGVSSAPAPSAVNLSVSARGADAGVLAMALADGGATGYRFQASWPTAGVADGPVTFTAFLPRNGGALASDPLVVKVDNTPPSLTVSLAGLVDGGPALPRDFQQTATLVADDHGGSGADATSFHLSGTGVPSSSTATWPVSASGTASVNGRDLLLDTGAAGIAGTFTLTAQVKDLVGNQSASVNLPVPVTRLKWKLKLATGAIDSSPVLGSRGRIYVGGNDKALHAVSPSGTLTWSYVTGDLITATPAVRVLDATAGTEIVYAPSQDANVHAVVGSDGGLLAGWTMLSAQPAATAPNTPTALANSAAVSPTENALVAGDNGGHIFSVKLGTGIVNGTYPQVVGNGMAACTAISIESVSGSLLAVVGGKDNFIYSLIDTTLAKQTSLHLLSSDVLDTSQSGGLGTSGDEAWVGAAHGVHHLTKLSSVSNEADAVAGPAGAYATAVALGSGSLVYAATTSGSLIEVASGSSKGTFSGLTAPPTIGADGNIYVATTDGKLASVRPDGSIQWEGGLTSAAINSAPMIDPCNRTLYVGSSDGFLFAVITDSAGLDTGPWPHFRHDYQGTGNASLTGAVDCANHL
jgi:hypothetical protein